MVLGPEWGPPPGTSGLHYQLSPGAWVGRHVPMAHTFSMVLGPGWGARCLWLIHLVRSLGLGGVPRWVPLTCTIRAVMGSGWCTVPDVSSWDHQHRSVQGGMWGLPDVNSVCCPKEWDPGAWSPLVQCMEMQEFSLVCTHCGCLGA